jgi:heptosyltransferase-2
MITINRLSDPAEDASGERILVVRNRFIGDTVLAIPFLRNLRRRFPEAVIDLLVEPAAATVLADCPYVDEIIEWRRPHGGIARLGSLLASISRQAAMLRSRRYTRTYVLKCSFTSVLLARWAGIPHRVGFAKRRSCSGLTHSLPIRPGRHEAELFLDLLRQEGIEVDDGHNENWTSPAAAAKVDRLLAARRGGRRRVFVAPRSTDVHREWPLGRFAAVLRWLVEKHDCQIFFCGAPDDRDVHTMLAALSGAASRQMHDLSCDLTLRETFALIARMDLCLGVDTGLPHIAASFGVPTAVLYGPTDPRKWHPWKTTSEIIAAPSGLISDIAVEEVMDAVSRLLEDSPRHGPQRIESLDLRQGRHRYGVAAARVSVRAAAVPATKPLAQAH